MENLGTNIRLFIAPDPTVHSKLRVWGLARDWRKRCIAGSSDETQICVKLSVLPVMPCTTCTYCHRSGACVQRATEWAGSELSEPAKGTWLQCIRVYIFTLQNYAGLLKLETAMRG